MKVSCLLVTKYPTKMFKRALRCFNRQTHQDKELVVVTEKSSPYAKEKSSLVDKCVLVEDGLGLGELRNIAVRNATGNILLQWDDDEINHPLRIEKQVEKLGNAYACYLQDRLHYFQNTKELYWEDGSYSFVSGREIKQHCPGTLMMRNTGEYWYESDRSWAEDIELMKRLVPDKEVVMLEDMGWLYVYTYHGSNIVPLKHHWNIARNKTYNKEHLIKNKKILQDAIFRLGLEGAKVVSNEGLAYKICGVL
jgi:glycosyltransferase involved in cell wall biosynthesis